MLHELAQASQVVLDRGSRNPAVREDTCHAALGQPVDGGKLLVGANLVERHVERHLHALAACLLRLAHRTQQLVRGCLVEVPVPRAAEDDARGVELASARNVIAHDGELVRGIGEVTPARANHRHHGYAARTGVARRRLDHPVRRRRAAHGQVVAQLHAGRARLDRRRDPLHILRAELPQKRHPPILSPVTFPSG